MSMETKKKTLDKNKIFFHVLKLALLAKLTLLFEMEESDVLVVVLIKCRQMFYYD